MIKVIDNYYVEVDVAKGCVNYIVRKGSAPKSKTGKNMDKPLGFCSTMSQAIEFIRQQIIANRLSEGERTLSEALRVVKKETDRLMKALGEEGIEK